MENQSLQKSEKIKSLFWGGVIVEILGILLFVSAFLVSSPAVIFQLILGVAGILAGLIMFVGSGGLGGGKKIGTGKAAVIILVILGITVYLLINYANSYT